MAMSSLQNFQARKVVISTINHSHIRNNNNNTKHNMQRTSQVRLQLVMRAQLP